MHCQGMIGRHSAATRAAVWAVFGLLLVAVVLSPACDGLPERVEEETTDSRQPARKAVAGVSSLGRIEPKDEIILISAPYFEGRPSLVKNLLVKEGDWVEEGQVLATLNTRNSYEAKVREAEARLPVMEARLRKAKEGPKEGDVAAQKVEIARWESILELDRADYERYRKLRATDDISASALDAKRRAVENAEKMLMQSRERLVGLLDIRPIDVELAELELRSAMASVRHARAELDLTSVKSPLRAEVLKVHAREGEEVGPAGLLELGRTDEMYVIAEVYETDISRVRVGGRATISGEVLKTSIEGTVERIGQQIEKNQVLPLDPTEFSDARIIKVHIRLDDSKPAAGLIHGRVSVQFHP